MNYEKTPVKATSGSGYDPDAAATKQVAARFALLTTSLLGSLLIMLGSVTFLATRAVLYNSLQSSLVQRAIASQDMAVHGLEVSEAGLRPGPPHPSDDLSRNGVFLEVSDANLNILFGSSPSGAATLVDIPTARRVAHGKSAPLMSTNTVHGDPLLIYTTAIVDNTGAIVGIIQTATSEREYLDSLEHLIGILTIMSVVGLIASAGISVVLAQKALSPIRIALKRQRDFVADAAHELRTPLTIMRSEAELGLSSESLAEQQVALEHTLAQNSHLTRLVEDLSLLARADSGAASISKSRIDVAEVARDVKESVGLLVEERDIKLTIVSDALIFVMADAGRIRQLILILLDNALKFTPAAGVITIRIDSIGNNARLVVTDSGPGIPEHDLPRLFERFYRSDESRSGEGTGLGLSIAQWIVSVHGGSIVAGNDPAGGAVFTIRLPLAR